MTAGLGMLLLAVGATAPAVDLAGARPLPGVSLTTGTGGALRLAPGGAGRCAALLRPELVTEAPVGVQAEIRAEGLWGRDAVVRLRWLAEDGTELGTLATPPVYANADWTAVTVYGNPPPRAQTAELALELLGDGAPHGFAEFRAVRLWPAPPITVSGPPLGVVWAPERLDATLEMPLPTGATLAAELVDVASTAIRTWPSATGGRLVVQASVPPGYYELRWRATDAEGGLLRDGAEHYAVLSPAPRPASSPFGVDAGFSWGIIGRGPETARALAELLARLGLRTVRDRFSIRATSPAPGRLELGTYAEAARIQREAGLRVYTITHDLAPHLSAAPADPQGWQAPPGDLREVYRFFAQAARATASDISAWELWNEPDIPMFFAGRPEEYAAFLKAGYLGLKAGNPNVNALFCSPAHPVGEWLKLVYDCGAADYYDTMNWHTYERYDRIPALAAGYRDLQIAHGYDAPMWLTETGSTADATPASERAQAGDYAKRYILAALSRVERVFGFYFQEWRMPGQAWFGVIRHDCTPRPALAALAALTEQLGDGEPLGEDRRWAPARIVWFESGAGPVAAAWSDTPCPLPPELRGAGCVAMVGTPRQPPDELGPDPVYLHGIEPPADLTPPPPRPARRSRGGDDVARLGVVLDMRLHPEHDAPLGENARKEPIRVAPGDAVPGEVAVYNFGARTAEVRLDLALPEAWRVDGLRSPVTVPPGDRVVLPLTCRIGPWSDVERYHLRLAGACDGHAVAPVTVALQPDPARLPTRPVRALGAPERWTTESNERVTMAARPAPGDDRGLRVMFDLAGPDGDRWGFANLALEAAETLTDGDGIRFGVEPLEPWGEELLVILFEGDGSQYLAHAGRLDTPARQVRLFWSDFRHNAGVSAEENARLDLDQVRRIGIGISAQGRAIHGVFELAGLELIRIGGER